MPDQEVLLKEAQHLCATAEKIAVLSGAGISAESGIPTYRTSQTGLWEQFDPQTLATPEAWRRDHQMVWAWYLWRNSLVRDVQPNIAHHTLAKWQEYADVRICTQNVDDLHERAGSTQVEHVHGTLFHFICSECRKDYPDTVDIPTTEVFRAEPPACPYCGAPIRPDIVWFGEMVPMMEVAITETMNADYFMVIGTSLVVYPAASLIDYVGDHVPKVIIDPNIPTLREDPSMKFFKETARDRRAHV